MMNLTKYLGKRIAFSFLTFLLILTLTFLLLRMLPDTKFIGQIPDKVDDKEEYVAEKREELGLDDPVIVQLGNYFYNLLPIPKEVCFNKVPESLDPDAEMVCEYETRFMNFGDSPESSKYDGKVIDTISERISISFVMNIIITLTTYAIAIPWGMTMARKKDTIFDKISLYAIIVLISIPSLVFFYLVIATQLSLQMTTMYEPGKYSVLITPILLASILGSASFALWIRRYTVDEMNSEYVKFARSKGLSENRIMFTHILRNTVVFFGRNLPIILIAAIMGSYFIETAWNIPGTGSLLINALTEYNLPMIQTLVLITSIIGILAVILGDLFVMIADPRISMSRNK